MVKHLGGVSIFVHDQDRAKDFYTKVLGFELRADTPLYPGETARWLAVAPQGAETEITLYLLDENWSHYEQVIGKSQAITLIVSDIAALHTELKAKGVTFLQEPATEPWGVYAIIQDSEENGLILVQQSMA